MSRDDDGHDALRNEMYELGKVVAQEALPSRFAKEAADAFARSEDKLAYWLRDFAKKLEAEATAARAEYVKKYRKGK